MRESLPPQQWRVLRAAARVARALHMPVYLVGGSVRDLLLGCPSPDLDLCVVGDGLAFARALARELGAPLSEDRRFLTAKIAAAAGGHKAPGGAIDVTTARREVYPHPGALPRVTPGAIEDDLARRDFTVNAMGVRLDRGAPRLLDPFGGRADLAQRRLRILHDRSFADDPTRLLRAARYAARLRFHMERHTLRLARQSVSAGCLDTVSGERIRRELLALLAGPRAEVGVQLCERLGVLRSLHPALAAASAGAARLRRVGRICERFSRRRPGENRTGAACCAPSDLSRLLVLADSPQPAHRLSPAAGAELSARLRLTARQAKALGAYLRVRSRARRALSAPLLRNSTLARTLGGLPCEAVIALAATSSPRVRRRCEFFLGRLHDMSSRLRGEDLAALGFAPGAAWGAALAAARDARLDGRARSKHDELRIAAAVLRARGRRRTGWKA